MAAIAVSERSSGESRTHSKGLVPHLENRPWAPLLQGRGWVARPAVGLPRCNGSVTEPLTDVAHRRSTRTAPHLYWFSTRGQTLSAIRTVPPWPRLVSTHRCPLASISTVLMPGVWSAWVNSTNSVSLSRWALWPGRM